MVLFCARRHSNGAFDAAECRATRRPGMGDSSGFRRIASRRGMPVNLGIAEMDRIRIAPPRRRSAQQEITEFCAGFNEAAEFGSEHIVDLAGIYRRSTPDVMAEVGARFAGGAKCLLIQEFGASQECGAAPCTDRARTIASAALLGFTAALGFKPYAFVQERAGSLVHDVRPEPGARTSISSSGVMDFSLHADCACLGRDLRPELLSFLCLVDESSTETEVAALPDVLRNLPAEAIEELAAPNFLHRAPDSFLGSAKDRVSSILDRVDGAWEVKVATHSCQPLTAAATSAFQRFVECANQARAAHRWRAGDLLLVNNRECLHGRRAIGQGKRHLLRCYGSRTQRCGATVDLSR